MTNTQAKRLALTAMAGGFLTGMGFILILANTMGWFNGN